METQSVASYSSTPGTHSGDEGISFLSARDYFYHMLHGSDFTVFTEVFSIPFTFSLADVIDEGVDVDFEDGFEQALAENIDSATQKR